VSLALALAVPVSAQASNHWYSPSQLGSKEGNLFAYYLGYYKYERHQQIDGELRGKVGSIKEIAMRLDGRSYSSYLAYGRTYGAIQIDMADGDYANPSTVMTANLKSTPTRVFSSPVTWPHFVGTPLTKPALWGGTKGSYRYPFKTAWLTLGTKDIVSDWNFSNGVASNGSTSWYMSVYYFDTYGYDTNQYRYGTYTRVPATRLNNNSGGVTGRCNDSAISTTTGSYMYGYFYAYGQYPYIQANWRNKIRLYSVSYYTAPNAPVIHAWGLPAPGGGINIGTGCNNLHLGQVLFMTTFMTLPLAINTSVPAYSPYVTLPLLPAAASLNIMCQGAWADSKTGKLNLTQATGVTIPDMNFSGSPPKRHTVRQYQYSATSGWRPTTTTGYSYANYYYCPGFRYAY